MKEGEKIKTFREKLDLIYGAFKKIRSESDQAVKLTADLFYTYMHKHDPVPGLNIAEKQITHLLGEVNKIYGEIDQNLKKINELIKADDASSSQTIADVDLCANRPFPSHY